MIGQVKIAGADGREVLINWRPDAAGETIVDLGPTPDGASLSMSVPKLLEAIGKMSEASKAVLMYRLG